MSTLLLIKPFLTSLSYSRLLFECDEHCSRLVTLAEVFFLSPPPCGENMIFNVSLFVFVLFLMCFKKPCAK